MSNTYIDKMSIVVKEQLKNAGLYAMTHDQKKLIKREYITKTIIIDIFLSIFLSSVSILIAYGDNDFATYMTLVIGVFILIAMLVSSFFILHQLLNIAYRDSYALKAYIAETKSSNDGHTKVYIVYYDKKKEKYVLFEDFLSMKNNQRRYDIKNHFVDIIVRQKKNKYLYVIMDELK